MPYCGVDWDPLLSFCAQICKGKETSTSNWSIPTSTPSWLYSQFRLWMFLSLPSRATHLVSPGWSHERRCENIPSALTWHLPFRVEVHAFSSPNPNYFVIGTSHGLLGIGGEVGVREVWRSPNGNCGSWDFICCRCGAATTYLEVKWELGFSGEG